MSLVGLDLIQAAALGSLLALGGAFIGWLFGMKADQSAIRARHEAHEKICSERYSAIEKQHRQLVKVSDERHEENRERLQGIDERTMSGLKAIDDKLQRLIEAGAFRH